MTITLIEIDGNVQGVSNTSQSVSTGVKNFTLTRSEPFYKGQSVTVRYDDTKVMTGIVTSVSATSITVNVTSVIGSGTFTTWYIDGDRTLYFATESYVSKADDSPAYQEYKGNIKNAGDVKQYMYSYATTFGASRLTQGDIIINNEDGEFDFIKNMGFKKGSLRIKQINSHMDNLPSETVFSGTIIYPEISLDKVKFSIGDRLSDLDKPAQESVFAGTNSGATGIEGTADSIKGLIKPFSYGGQILNVKATLLNSSKLIYGLNFSYTGNSSPILSISSILDAGLTLSLDTTVGTAGDVANLAALQSATITTGKYITCLSEGLFRLNSSPQGAVTVNYTESNSKAGDIVKKLIERIGLTSSDYSVASITALNTAKTYPHELYVTDKETVLSLCNTILSGIGAFIISNVDNKIEVGLLTDPALGTPIHSFDQWTTIDFVNVGSRDTGKGIPPKQINLSYRRNYNQMVESDFAGSVSDASKQLLIKNNSVTNGVINTNIERKHFNAPIFDIDSRLTTESDANTERTLQETLRQKERDFYSLSTYDTTTINLGAIIKISNSTRFDLKNGLNVIVLGKEIDFAKNRITYIVWG
jgi:hypothetical protein